jgi:hypothetical protein
MEEKREKRRRAAPRKIRHRKKMEALRASAIQTDPEPLVPEEGLVCMGEGCWIYNLLKHEYSNVSLPSGRCPGKKKGKKCDAMF